MLVKEKLKDNNKLMVISIGHSRYSKHWKNTEMFWSDFVKRLSKTTRTNETVQEYKNMTKTEQGAAKDVGGFVGGALKKGRRKGENVANRSLITLDMDYFKGSVDKLWKSITFLYGCNMAMYSTHSHTPENPRLRLIIPLDTPVYTDQYQAISRRIADDIGIDLFDDSTYEASRLMYWPSTPIDGEYVFKYQIGDFLKGEDVLKRYTDWKDVSQWPASNRLDVDLENKIKRQEDPLEKSGLVGAFCKTYSITEVIDKFLSDIYIPTANEDRYTYKPGSTVGGLVIYDDKFAYSHHGTDPTGGKLCNAFDLVRLHLYGDLDYDAKENTPVNRLPSYLKMLDVIGDDDSVKVELGKERIREVEDDFDFKEDKLYWLKKLTYDKKGNIENTIDNAVKILKNDERVKGKLVYDEFSNRAIVRGRVPWKKDVKKESERDWTDTDDSGVRHFLENSYGITTVYKIDDAKSLAFESNKIHPVREYLENLKWDGVERVETILVDYLGAEDNIYTRAVSKLQLVGAVARIMKPGIKLDTMVTLIGPQGIGKSTFLYKLSKGWFSDSLENLRGKEAAEHLQGVWMVEMSELNATKKSDRDTQKAFLSRQYDIYRVAYAKHTTRFPRQCVFWGSTNDLNFLRDPTGDRRTLPIDCWVNKTNKDIFTELDEEVDQIWAEAVELYKEDTSLYLTGKAKKIAIEKQKEHKEDNPLSGLIEGYLDRRLPDEWDEMPLIDRVNFLKGDEGDFGVYEPGNYIKDRVCVLEIWCELLNKKPGDLKPINSREINDILRGLDGWVPSKSTLSFGNLYGKQRGYIRESKTINR